VQTGVGTLRAASVGALAVGTKVVLSVRPEDVYLSETRPEVEVNSFQGTVDQKVFIGEALDWQIRVGSRTLQSRTHPSIRTPIGQPTWLHFEASKCVALPAAAELAAA
jgi:iron(III) transport system ATP-binding protein